MRLAAGGAFGGGEVRLAAGRDFLLGCNITSLLLKMPHFHYNKNFSLTFSPSGPIVMWSCCAQALSFQSPSRGICLGSVPQVNQIVIASRLLPTSILGLRWVGGFCQWHWHNCWAARPHVTSNNLCLRSLA